MSVVRLYIENINNIHTISASIEQLGARHYQMGIKSEYINVMGPVFCHTVRPLLVSKNLWTLELEEVWLCLFKYICHSMKKGYPKDKRKASKLLRCKSDSIPKA